MRAKKYLDSLIVYNLLHTFATYGSTAPGSEEINGPCHIPHNVFHLIPY